MVAGCGFWISIFVPPRAVGQSTFFLMPYLPLLHSTASHHLTTAGAQKQRALLALVPPGHSGAREDGAGQGLLRPGTTEQGARGREQREPRAGGWQEGEQHCHGPIN